MIGTVSAHIQALADYIADPSARCTPVHRDALTWYAFHTTPEERMVVVRTADRIAPHRIHQYWLTPPSEDQVVSGHGWQVTASNRWDASTTTSPDRSTVTVTLRRRP